MEPINNHGYHLRDVTGSTSIDTDTYSYDANGNLVSHNGRSYTWTSDNLPSRLTIPNLADEHYTYDADGERLTRTVNGVTTVYLAGLWEEEIPTGVTRSHYALQEQVVAQRSSSPNTVLYLHRDHLGSVSAATDATGLLVSKQDFTPWGEIRGGGSGMTETSLNYTGQRRDLFYHARYYDPNLGRFLSADTVVPGAPDGSMDGVALTPLTVDFHEPGFLTGIAEETTQGFWFQRSSQERQQTTAPWGPANPQALNRYSYVQNNPLKYTDPTGHIQEDGTRDAGYETVCQNGQGQDVSCHDPGAKPVTSAQGELMRTWVANDDGTWTYAYWWSKSDQFLDFKDYVKSMMSTRATFLSALVGLGASVVALGVCAGTGGGAIVLCAVGVLGTVASLGALYAAYQDYKTYRQGARTQMRHYRHTGVRRSSIIRKPPRNSRFGLNPFW
jgi:RHS repeat-associated protein